MDKSEQIDALAKALVKVQGTMENAVKGADNPFFKSTYATLSDIWEVARKPLTDNGLSVTQLCESADGQNVIIETVLLHESGQWIGGRLSMPYVKNDPQAVGSAISYGRRYALQSILGIVAEEDDDANHASGKGQIPKSDNPHPPSAPKSPAPPKSQGEVKDLRKEIMKMLIESEGNEFDAAMKLKELSGFQGKNRETGEEKWVEGKEDPKDFSEKMLPVAYGKVQKYYLAWQKEAEGGNI